MALHTGDSVTCAVCNRKFDSADSLAMHTAVHSEIAPPQSPTPLVTISTIAGKTTMAGSTMAMIAVTSAMTTAATITTTATATTMTTVETSDSQKPYQCQHCGRRFTRPHEKVKHERIHTGEKPHACEVHRHSRLWLDSIRSQMSQLIMNNARNTMCSAHLCSLANVSVTRLLLIRVSQLIILRASFRIDCFAREKYESF